MKAFFVSILLLSFFLQVSAAFGQQPNQIDSLKAQIETLIQQKMSESGIVGIGAAVIVDNRLAWSKGFGFADRENKRPFTTDTIMNIGSISKTFTGVCLMRAVEDGKLSLDEDINKYLPFKVVNPYFPDERITLRHLATHTSSLADRYPFYSDSLYHYGADSPEDLGGFLKDYFEPHGKYYSKENFLNKKPGTYRDYSNIAAGLAGFIVEIATGAKLNVLSKKQIFDLLGMKNSGWFLREIDRRKHSKLYRKEGDEVREIRLYGVTTYPDGGVRTSVSELSRFFIALLNDGEHEGMRILRKESVHEMQRFQFSSSNRPENVNITELNSGIFWATKRNTSFVGHAGSDPGVKTEMLVDRNKEVGVILFTNTGLSDQELGKYHFKIFDELYKFGGQLRSAKSVGSRGFLGVRSTRALR